MIVTPTPYADTLTKADNILSVAIAAEGQTVVLDLDTLERIDFTEGFAVYRAHTTFERVLYDQARLAWRLAQWLDAMPQSDKANGYVALSAEQVGTDQWYVCASVFDYVPPYADPYRAAPPQYPIYDFDTRALRDAA